MSATRMPSSITSGIDQPSVKLAWRISLPPHLGTGERVLIHSTARRRQRYAAGATIQANATRAAGDRDRRSPSPDAPAVEQARGERPTRHGAITEDELPQSTTQHGAGRTG